MRDQTWSAIDEKFRKYPSLRAEGVTYEEIDAASAGLGFSLDPDYREFVHRYGGAIVGPYPIFGLRKAEAMGRREMSAFEITAHYRKQGWRGVQDWLIVSADHAGNPIGLASDNKIWISDHDFGQVTVIADSFENYIRNQCLKLDSGS